MQGWIDRQNSEINDWLNDWRICKQNMELISSHTQLAPTQHLPSAEQLTFLDENILLLILLYMSEYSKHLHICELAGIMLNFMLMHTWRKYKQVFLICDQIMMSLCLIVSNDNSFYACTFLDNSFNWQFQNCWQVFHAFSDLTSQR